MLPLDRESPEPLRSQLERGLRDAVRSGRLRAGERLPSSREMARELGVSRGLVQDCYVQLHLRRVRAAVAEPGRIVVCTGFAQGLSLVLGVLVRAGVRQVAFEDPGYGDGPTKAAAVRAGVEPVPVAVDEHGIDVGVLAASGAGAVLLTPAHQWPTGVVLAPDRRHQLIAWASARDGVLIEDDYDAEFRYDRHLRRMRGTYATRRAAIVDALARHAPHVEPTGLAAGFHTVAHLRRDSADERTVVEEARARSVGLYGMSTYRSTRATTPPQLVLGFGNLGERAIHDGIAAVADLL